MKILKNILVLFLAVVFAVSCNQGIDSITPIAPGPDEDAPMVTINYPVEGTQIQKPETVSSIDIKFEVTDDIEIGSVKVLIDGSEIASYDEFIDYRRFLDEFPYDNVTNGTHILTVTAVDLENKSTTVNVNFEKVPPYTPLFDGEIFYMPFDGDYMEMLSFQNASVFGTPGFSDDSHNGLAAYLGATDSYLTFPMESLKNSEFSAAFWYRVNPDPDRAGILCVGASPDSRNEGFRLFREGSSSEQRIKLNVGTGTSESWNDGDVINAAISSWVHVAISVTQSKSTIYLNGNEARSADLEAGIDWTNCETLTIGAGGETFSYWNHLSDLSLLDELRFFNKALSQAEVQHIIEVEGGDVSYQPKYGEILYMPFDGDYKDLVSDSEAGVVGSPGFDEGKINQAYMGATDSYLTFPAADFIADEFSAVFWMKVNSTPDRSGILSVGSSPDSRNQGFRLFREGSETEQRIKLNVGTGTGESWNDGDVIDVTAGEWIQIAISISQTQNTIYFNGEEMRTSAMDGFDWTDCETITIGAGGETFSYWNHLSDLSLYDEMRFFDKALTQEQIKAIFDAEN